MTEGSVARKSSRGSTGGGGSSGRPGATRAGMVKALDRFAGGDPNLQVCYLAKRKDVL